MGIDQSTEALKTMVKVVGSLLLISVLFIVIFVNDGTKPLGYLFFAVIGFFAWRMVQDWTKSTVQVYALIQSIMTGVAAAQICSLFWPPHIHPAITGLVVILMGSPLERFLVRYTGFSREVAKDKVAKNSVAEVAGTPWQSNPGYTR